MSQNTKPGRKSLNDPALKRQCFRKAEATAFLKCLCCFNVLLTGVVTRSKTLPNYYVSEENHHAQTLIKSAQNQPIQE